VSREELIRKHFDRTMRLLEIGPSYNPILPKAEGWRTTVIDHATQRDLIEKYNSMGVKTVDRIEPVDHVWREGPLSAVVPNAMRGTYDGLVASHVAEHFPDLIAFFQDATALVRPRGAIALALPDKRVCFDFFQPLATTGDLVAAHAEGRTRHQRKTFFNQAALYVTRGQEVGWAHTGNTAPFHLPNPLSLAQHSYDTADESPNAAYRDSHAWAFTPKSFELLILELNLLGHINWAIRAIEPASAIEFYVWLEQKRIEMPEAAVNPLRMSLLTAITLESRDAVAQLESVPEAPASAPASQATEQSKPRIAVVIPLYNGARYIEQALNSVFTQRWPADEIIIVNDGSTDDGAGVAVVERLARTRALTLLHKANGGQSSARNMGVAHSACDLVAFLDQDDLWYENHLQELVQPFLSPAALPLGWTYSNLDEIDEHGYLVCRSYLGTLSAVHPKRHIYDCIRQDMFILPSASLVCRKSFEAVGGFDERLSGYEDDDLFMRMFRMGYNSIYLDQALSQWRIYPGSSSYTYRMAQSRNIYLRKLLDMFPNDKARERYYARDLIVPRFFETGLREYQATLQNVEPKSAAAAWNELVLLSSHNDRLMARLVHPAVMTYKAALLKGDDGEILHAWRELAALVVRIPTPPSKLRWTLSLLRSPTVSKYLFAVRNFARPAMLWAFSH